MSERKEKFTRGPWKSELPISEVLINGHPHDVYPIESDNIGCAVCIIPNEDITDESIIEVKANAALIAAAPDMYAALNTALDYLLDRKTIKLGDAVDAIDAALDKAIGKR